MSYENVLYFAISRDLDDKDQIYGKFGNHKVGLDSYINSGDGVPPCLRTILPPYPIPKTHFLQASFY